MKARYICLEGTEGVGKTTQTQCLVDHLRSKGYKVLQTKEPGTVHLPVTMVMRGLILDKQYDNDITPQARELLTQAIRSIHLDKLIVPSLSQYDYIIQDRGILSGLAYGSACGNKTKDLLFFTDYITDTARINMNHHIYDDIIYLRGNIKKGLDNALSSKQEFEGGDAMEAKGLSFIEQVGSNMDSMKDMFNTHIIEVDGKSKSDVLKEILAALKIEE